MPTPSHLLHLQDLSSPFSPTSKLLFCAEDQFSWPTHHLAEFENEHMSLKSNNAFTSFFFLIGGKLFYNVVLVSAIQQHEATIIIYIYIFIYIYIYIFPPS